MRSPRRFATVALCCAAIAIVGCSQETAPDAADTAPDPEPAEAEMPAAEVESPPAEAPMTALERGRAFLAENGQREEVVTTASGLQYEVLASGTGGMPGPTDQVSAHYHGTLITGDVFDSSVERGQPLDIRVNGVIQGWQEALQMMRVGDKWKLYIPSELAYGKAGAGASIGPDEALIFEVELLSIAGA